jgi:hypothetical protein
MTSVPPEPPAGSGPQPPSPGMPPVPPEPPAQQWSGPPPGEPAPAGRRGVDPATVKPMDWGIIVAGLLALIFSTFDYYTATARAGGFSASASASAWHGFFGWFAALLALVAAILLAVHLFAPSAQLPIPIRLTVLGGFLLAALCVIIAGFVTPGAGSVGPGVSVDYGRGAGYYLSLIVILAGAVLAYLRLRETDGTLPWEKSRT